MKTRTALLISFVMLLQFSATRLLAETDASCCRCKSLYKLSDEGFGFLRHHIGFCPKCTEEMGGNIDAYLEKLRGKNRGLADAAQLTLAQIRQSTAARDKARDAIYGGKGLATGFFKSLMSFAAEGASGTIKTVATNVKKGLGWYNKASDSLQGDFKWVIKEGKSWVSDKTVGAAKDKALIKTAAAMGQSYRDRGGSPRGATNQFLNAHSDLKKGVSILEGAIDFYEKTDQLANGIQDYLEHRANAQRLWKEWNDITDQMEALLKEIAQLEHCRELQKQQGKTSRMELEAEPSHRRWAGAEEATVRFASATIPADEPAAVKALVFPPKEPNAAALQSALSALQRLRTELSAFIRNLDEEVIPPLLFFWLDLQGATGPEFAKALLEWADAPTDLAARQFDRLIRYGDGIAEDVKRANPGGESI